MNTETQASEVKAIEKAKTTTLVIGTTVISGAELVPDKLLGVLTYVLSNEETGVAAITFRDDDLPKGLMGQSNPVHRCCVINMEHIFNRTLQMIEKGDNHLNLAAAMWLAVLDTTFHEMFHVSFAFNDPTAYAEYLESGKLMVGLEDSEKGQTEYNFEEAAEEYSAEMIVKLAKEIDIECPAIADMGHFGVGMMMLFTDTDIMKDSKFLRRAQRQLEQGIVYEDTEEEVFQITLREYIRTTIANEKDGGGEDWEQPVSLINMRTEQVDGTVVVDKAEPVVANAAAAMAATTAAAAAVAESPAMAALAAANPTLPAATVASPSLASLFPGAGAKTSYEDASAGIDESAALFNQAGLDSVVLPVGVQTTVNAAGAAAAGPATPEVPKTYDTAVEVPDGKLAPLLQAIYMRLYTHMFAKCGWSQNPATGQFHFANLDAAIQSVPIDDIFTGLAPEAKGLVAEYITVSPQGQDGYLEPCQGYVRGLVYRNKQLPGYKIYLNIGGNRICRTLVPQNPQKQNAQNAYSRPAQEAQVGHARCYVLDGDLGFDAPWSEKCKAEIVNNEYIPKG
jgi:hypothetical protein